MMQTFEGVTIADEATGRPLTGVPVRVVDVSTEAPVTTYLEGVPVQLVTNRHGYVPAFQTAEEVRFVRLEAGAGRAYRWAVETVSAAAALGSSRLTGSGHPEGVVAASVGTSYRDVAGTGGAWEWIKVSGAGNAGWRVLSGSTGIRDLAGTILTAPAVLVSAGEPNLITRDGDLVQMTFTAKSDVAWTSGAVAAVIPEGFRPSTTVYLPSGYAGGGSAAAIAFSTGDIKIYVPTTWAGRWQWVWPTKQAWPTVLPGTAF